MATPQTHARSGTGGEIMPTGVTAWAGWVLFAGIMLFVVGSFQITLGLVALFKNEYFGVASSGLLLPMDYTAWGWIHLVLGIVQIATSLGLIVGHYSARIIGVVLAVLSMLLSFAFIAAFPLLATMIIAFDLLTIYAIAVHGHELRPEFD